MACFSPLDAWQTPTGQIVFYDSPGTRYMQLSCGQCAGCRLKRSSEWALRCVHEAQLHKQNCFITLTYNSVHLPDNASLVKRDHQLFFRRLRKAIKPKKVKYYLCGEYGSKGRPHYHAIVFGHDFCDRVFIGKTNSGHDLYTSPELERIWGKGFVQVGDVTYESAAYVARYIMKKVLGKGVDQIDEETGLKPYERYDSKSGEIFRVLPEYTAMSRGGRNGHGIAHDWITRFSGDCYPKDYIHHDGRPVGIPRYYDEYMKRNDAELIDGVKAYRAKKGYESKDNTPERLKVREVVENAKINQLRRNLP